MRETEMKPGQGMREIAEKLKRDVWTETGYGPMPKLEFYLVNAIETALTQVAAEAREAAIEECAKIADRMCKEEEESEDRNEHSNAAAEAHWQCADQIRALAAPSKEGEK